MIVEERLKQKIQKFLGSACNCKWTRGDVQRQMGLQLAERKNISMEVGGCGYKYIEYSDFKQNGKACIGIGFNPAQSSPNKIDNTNSKLIRALIERQYGSFILLNIYPLVSASKADFDESDENSIAFAKECLPSLLEYVCNKTDADVLIFWGRTVSVEREIFKQLQELCNRKRLYMTVKKGKDIHCHPAYVTIEIKQVSHNNLQEAYSVR